MDISLLGKNALVGGGSAGIGRAVAIELAELGANVTVMARTEANLVNTVNMLDIKQGQKHGFLVVDYSDSQALVNLVEALVQQQPIHVLVNNTGGPPGGALALASAADLTTAYHNHLICNHLLTQTVLPSMKSSGYGRIINIISTSVKEPIEGLGVSNSTRWAVASWAKTLSVELGAFGITVNNVLPGFTQTSRLDEIIEKRMKNNGDSRTDVEAGMKGQVPLRRFANPAEIAATVAFLASPAAGYVNGINLPVDGGRTKSL